MADLTPHERERIFLEEKARLEAREGLESKKAKATTNSFAAICLALLAVPAGLWILTTVTGAIARKVPAPELSAEQKKRIDLHGPRPDLYELQARIENSLKKTARDPDSVKIYEWSDIFFNDKDGWIIKADWGAKNGFGGMTRAANWFVVSKKGYTVKPGDAYQ